MSLSTNQIRKRFLDLIHSLDPATVGKRPSDFSRNRLCPLPDTIMLLLSMAGHTLNTEIGNYYAAVNKIPPSQSAFAQQRNKLLPDVFPEILSKANSLFPFTKTFKGLHLLAADGSDVNIPSLPGDTSTFMKVPGREGYYQVHLNAVYDLLEHRYCDGEVTPRNKINENGALCEMIDRCPLEKSLFIADRGYVCFNTMAHVIQNGHFFLIRARKVDSSSSLFKNIPLPDSDTFDMDVSFCLGRSRSRKSKDGLNYKHIQPGRPFDYLPLGDRKSSFNIDLRLVKIQLGGDTFEYLMTNLPKNKFPLSCLKELYHMRWGIETSFRQVKYNLALNCFHSRKRDYICQEIYARLIMYNLIALLIGSVTVKQKNTKYQYQISFSDSVPYCRRFLITRMTAVKLKNLLLKCRIPIRPDRSAPRHVRSQKVTALNNRY